MIRAVGIEICRACVFKRSTHLNQSSGRILEIEELGQEEKEDKRTG